MCSPTLHWASEGHQESKQVESVCLPTNLLRREREIEDCPVSLILINHVICQFAVVLFPLFTNTLMDWILNLHYQLPWQSSWWPPRCLWCWWISWGLGWSLIMILVITLIRFAMVWWLSRQLCQSQSQVCHDLPLGKGRSTEASQHNTRQLGTCQTSAC